MNEKIKHNRDDEEFQFTEVEEPDLFEPETKTEQWSPSELTSKLNRRNLVIIAGVIILLLAIYKLWGIFSAPPKPQPAPVRPTIVSPPSPPKIPVESSELIRIQQQITLEKERTNTLEVNVNNLTNNMTGMQQSLDSIKTQLSDMMTMLKEQQAEIQALKPKPKPKLKVSFCPPPPKPKRVPFYIKAVVSGRAWLVAPNGHTVTVAVGDRLPGYGKIVAISPVRSTVTTSSGTIIRYRVNVSSTNSPYI